MDITEVESVLKEDSEALKKRMEIRGNLLEILDDIKESVKDDAAKVAKL